MTNLDPAIAVPKLELFLKSLAKDARLDLRFKVTPAVPKTEHDPQLVVECDGQDVDILLGRGGELLDALEHLSAKVLRLHSDEQGLISFDSHHFRADRALELRLIAETAAERVQRSGQKFDLSPMNSRDRRIVHLALQDRSGIRTESEGNGPQRHIVIYPAK
jgi:spoIIIJ-associated protein